MSLSNVLHISNLALLICHLFIGGNFRIGHILFDPKVYNDDLTSEIDSVCRVQIPWITMEITQPTLMPQFVSEKTDHILQLVFFETKFLAEQIDEYKEFFTFYRVFVFSSKSDGFEMKQRIFIIQQTNPIPNSNPLVVHQNEESGLVNVQSIFDNTEAIEVSKNHLNAMKVNRSNIKDSSKCLFEKTFGQVDQKNSIGIKVTGVFRKVRDSSTYVPIFGHLYFANYFVSTCNAYVKMTSLAFNDIHAQSTYRLLNHKSRHSSSELLLEYEPIEEKKAEKLDGQTNTLHFDGYYLPKKDQGKIVSPLYPYHSIELSVVFVYGDNFTRQMNIFLIPGTIELLTYLLVVFIGLASGILCFIRKRYRLRRDGIISTFIDTIVAFIAGGNLRMNHKLERYFFAVMLIAAFFITSIFTGNILFYTYRILNQRFTTFKELSNVNTPIYINQGFGTFTEDVHQMLRRKIGPNINYVGVESKEVLIKNQEISFVYVIETIFIENLRDILTNAERDFDVLEESLGALNSQFFL